MSGLEAREDEPRLEGFEVTSETARPASLRYTAETWVRNNAATCETLLDLYFNGNCSRRGIAKQLGMSRETVSAVLRLFQSKPDSSGAAFFVNSLPLAKKLKRLVNPLDEYIDEKIRIGIETSSLSLQEAIELREKIMPDNKTVKGDEHEGDVIEVADYEMVINGLGGEKKSGAKDGSGERSEDGAADGLAGGEDND